MMRTIRLAVLTIAVGFLLVALGTGVSEHELQARMKLQPMSASPDVEWLRAQRAKQPAAPVATEQASASAGKAVPKS
jgi:hypothetical protein